MYFYQVLPTRKIPTNFLTYSSHEQITVGNLVEVNIRGREVEALIISEQSYSNLEKAGLDTKKIKLITKDTLISFNSSSLHFLKLFIQNTLNYPANSLKNFLQPYKLLTKKNWQEIEGFAKQKLTNKKNVKKFKSSADKLADSDNLDIKNQHQKQKFNIKNIEFLIDQNYILRIKYIIRKKILSLFKAKNENYNENKKTYKILFIFPETKLLDKILFGLETELEKLVQENSGVNFNKFVYTGKVSKESKLTARKLILSRFQQKLNKNTKKLLEFDLFFTTRSGIFLPFDYLDGVILLDEANSMHIQEQNVVYFDTRDIAYLLAQSYNSNLYYISSLPSTRLYSFYNSDELDNIYKDSSSMNLPSITIIERNPKADTYELFSYTVEQIIKGECE